MDETDLVDADEDSSPAAPQELTIGRRIVSWLMDETVVLPGRQVRWHVGAVALFASILAVAILVWLVNRSVAVAAWAGHQALTRVVTNPMHHYLDGHTIGLPVPIATVWWTWWAAGLLFFTVSVAGWRPARLGWTLFGLLTVAGVAAGNAPVSRWTAAGIAAMWWAVLSLFALRPRPQPRPEVIGPAAPPIAQPAEISTPPRDMSREPRDNAAALARVYEMLLRRRETVEMLRPPPKANLVWTLRADRNSFAGNDVNGRPVRGDARTPEAVTELLAQLSPQRGDTPEIRWTTTPLTPAASSSIPRGPDTDLPALAHFIDESPTELALIREAMQERRAHWNLDDLPAQLNARAADLNETWPLLPRRTYLVDERQPEDYLGMVSTLEWIDPTTIVATPAAAWNDFRSHRPEVVGLIVRALLTSQGAALDDQVRYILSEGEGVYVTRYFGPNGPIHEVTANGTHRAHAWRMLDVPALAAQVDVYAIPITINGLSDGAKAAAPMWRGLIRRGLLRGDIDEAWPFSVLTPNYVAAPWLLLPPRQAAAMTHAYLRRYPNSFDIPPAAMVNALSWTRWLTEFS